MSRTRDIADILGKSEDVNPSNLKFLKLGDAGGDAANVVNVSINASGLSEKTAGNRIEIGDAVVVGSDGNVYAAGQPFTPHRILNDSDGCLGQWLYADASADGSNNAYGSFTRIAKYLGGNKILVCIRSGNYSYARVAKLDNAGTTIVELGPEVLIQGQFTSGSGTYGTTNILDFDVEPGTGFALAVFNIYSLIYAYNNYYGTRGYGRFIYNDITNPNDLTITLGANFIWGNTGSSNTQPADWPRVLWDEEHSCYFVVSHDESQNQRFEVTRVTRNGYNVDTSSSQTYIHSTQGNSNQIVAFEYFKNHKTYAIFYQNNSNRRQVAYFRVTNSTGTPQVIRQTNNYLFDTSSNVVDAYTVAYDSDAGHIVMASSAHQNQGEVFSFGMAADSVPTDSTGLNAIIKSGGIYSSYIHDVPHVVNLKGYGEGRNLIVWDDNNADKTYVKYFTCDSVGDITLEDSTHTLDDSNPRYLSVNFIDDYNKVLYSAYYAQDWQEGAGRFNTNATSGIYQRGRFGFIYEPEKREVTNVTANNYLGISQDSADSGETVSVKVNGLIDTNQFGLVPGTTYYINEINGNLEPTTTFGSVRAGIATDVGNIKIISIYDSDA